MLYRPQMAFTTPAGFRDETFHFSFDGSNVAALSSGNPVPAGGSVNNILLQLQNDAEFVLRAWKIQRNTTGGSDLAITIKDPFGNYLSAAPIALARYLRGDGAAVVGRVVVAFEAEIVCPIGGFFEVFLYNPTAAPLNPPLITMFGVNRYPLERAA